MYPGKSITVYSNLKERALAAGGIEEGLKIGNASKTRMVIYFLLCFTQSC